MNKKKLREKILDLLLDLANKYLNPDDKRIIFQARHDIKSL